MDEKTTLIGIIVVLSILCFAPFTVTGQGDIHEVHDSSEGYTVTDARGEEIKFNQTPQRIVSFMPSNTEILFYLGVGDRVVATDDFSDYPKEAKDLPKVGNARSVDYEKIIDLNPDVVVVPSYNREMINSLKEYDQKVFATGSSSLEDVYSDMNMLGKMCGIGDKAERMADELKNKMDKVTEGRKDIPMQKRPDVFYIAGVQPSIYTPGNGTFQHTLIRMAGGNNIASNKSGWKPISEEKIIAANPDIIIAPKSMKKQVKGLTGKVSWENIAAVKNNQTYFVNSDIFSRPGPRVIKAEKKLVNITEDVEEYQSTETEKVVPGLNVVLIPVLAALIALIRRKKET